MFDQRKVREEAVKRQHDKITEKVTMSNGAEINVRTKLSDAIDIPEMPDMPEMPYTETRCDEPNYGYLQELSDSMYGGVGNVTNQGMTRKAREDFIDLIRSMSEEEQRLVAETLPIDICFQRIKDEIDRQRKFSEAITNAMQFR